jgi:hypothetical protein
MGARHTAVDAHGDRKASLSVTPPTRAYVGTRKCVPEKVCVVHSCVVHSTAVEVSEDGSRVYFVARGVPADTLDVGGVGARLGADNLHVCEHDAEHPAGHLPMSQTPQGSTQLAQGRCPDHCPQPISTRARSYGCLRHTGTPSWRCGSTVIFDTADALSPDDANGVGDMSGRRDGWVSLISAVGGTAVRNTPSGCDIFFSEDQCQAQRAVRAAQRRTSAVTGKVSLTVTARTVDVGATIDGRSVALRLVPATGSARCGRRSAAGVGGGRS